MFEWTEERLSFVYHCAAKRMTRIATAKEMKIAPHVIEKCEKLRRSAGLGSFGFLTRRQRAAIIIQHIRATPELEAKRQQRASEAQRRPDVKAKTRIYLDHYRQTRAVTRISKEERLRRNRLAQQRYRERQKDLGNYV